MGLILAIETSTPTARVAILDGDGNRRAACEATAERHSSNLLRLCDEALRAAGVAPAALDAIACGAGPGNFTGLRVGLAVGKGLALPTGRPFVLISSLAALAFDILGTPGAAGAGSIAVPCIDAGKGQVYVGFFRADAGHRVVALSEEWAVNPGDVIAGAPADALSSESSASSSLLVAGNGAVRHAEAIDAALLVAGTRARRIEVAGPSADSLGRLALLRRARGESDSLEASVPSYGRPPDITRPRGA